LEVRGDRYTHRYTANDGKDTQKEVVLNDTDPLWPRLRHLHVADAIDTLLGDFQKFINDNQAAGLHKGQVTDLKQMAEAIKKMPQYRELMAKYSLHMDVTRSCMARFNERTLDDVAEVEQTLATGLSADNKKAKKPQMLAAVSEMMRDRRIQPSDKLRLVLIYLLVHEESNTEARRAAGATLLSIANLSHLDSVVKNLDLVAPRPPATSPNTSSNITSLLSLGAKKSAAKGEEVSFQLSRYQPPIKWVMQDQLKGTLPAGLFPHVNAPQQQPAAAHKHDAAKTAEARDPEDILATAQSVRSRARSRARGQAHAQASDESKGLIDSAPVLVVLFCGPVTYSETRAAYALTQAHKRLVLVGGTEIAGPRTFVSDLERLHDPLVCDAAQVLDARAGSAIEW